MRGSAGTCLWRAGRPHSEPAECDSPAVRSGTDSRPGPEPLVQALTRWAWGPDLGLLPVQLSLALRDPQPGWLLYGDPTWAGRERLLGGVHGVTFSARLLPCELRWQVA